MTKERLKSRGKLPVDKERLSISAVTETRIYAQFFSGEEGIQTEGPNVFN